MPDPSLTGSIARYELPHPLSALYRKYRCASTSALRWGFGIVLAEGIFRFLAYVNLAAAVANASSSIICR